jgi:hypothetical protein
MNITLKTDFIKDGQNAESIQFTFNTEDLAKIVQSKGLEAGNKALDSFVTNYTQKLKETLGRIINK